MTKRWGLLLSLVLLYSGPLLVGQSRAASGTVVRVIDGDTIVVTGVGTVRLIGVDSPEKNDQRTPMQYFGREASEFTERLTGGRTVRLEYEGSDHDRYDRILAYVFLADGTHVNAELIRQGYAYAHTQFPFSRMKEFTALQRDAMAQRRGLWASDADAPASHADGSNRAALAVERAVSQPTSNAPDIVYATRTGSKYHRAGCRYLARSQIPLRLKEAAARYGACSVCEPPVF